jgi:lipoprotein-anchoring transpeptidase ErfK/SrfK
MNKSFRKSLIAVAILAGAGAIAGMTVGTADDEAGARLVADLSDKILYVYEAGSNEPQMFDIADGKEPYPTPRGSFTIRKLTWNPSWTPPDSKWARNKRPTPPGDPKNPMKIVKIFFKEPDYYIHGTGDIGSLGASESHGCIRMAPDDVMKLGQWVMLHGGHPHEENWFMRLLHSRREEKVIYLSTPVSIRIQE